MTKQVKMNESDVISGSITQMEMEMGFDPNRYEQRKKWIISAVELEDFYFPVNATMHAPEIDTGALTLNKKLSDHYSFDDEDDEEIHTDTPEIMDSLRKLKSETYKEPYKAKASPASDKSNDDIIEEISRYAYEAEVALECLRSVLKYYKFNIEGNKNDR